MEITSPFLESINECRTRMKKLRKKIYKNLKAKQHTTASHHHKNITQNVSHLFRGHLIPEFLNSIVRSNSGEDALRDITNINLTDMITFEELRVYSDGQEQ